MATPCSALCGRLFFLAPAAHTSAHRTLSFFPKYEYPLNQTVHNNCSCEYAAYLEGDHNSSTIPPELTIWVSNSSYDSYSLLINCILKAMPEIYKSDMASAQVLLGLTPTILASIGPSVYETAPLIASGRSSFPMTPCVAQVRSFASFTGFILYVLTDMIPPLCR